MRDVVEWLEGLGLGDYAYAFVENKIDAAVLASLTNDDLIDMGVAAVGDRRKILDAIAALAKRRVEPAEVDVGEADLTGPRRAEAERRQLTVMFCELVGSTELSGALDLEDYREVIRAYQDACAAVVARYDGHMAKFLGDGILIYFGYPQAHEDDAERAVRAGLEIIVQFPILKLATTVSLQCRIGVATGLVIAGDLVGAGGTEKKAVLGETPNLAARLQESAPPEALIISDSTHRLLGDLFEIEDLGLQNLKGIAQPVRAWWVKAARAMESRFEAAHGAGSNAFVGREQEVALLQERWGQAKEGEGQMVLLTGEAGIGKSRIVQALRERIAGEPHTRLRYQCSPYHTNSALHPFIAQLQFAGRIDASEPAEAKLDKLEALLGQSTDSVADVAPLFAELLSIPTGERYQARELTPAQRRERTLTALAAQLAGLAGRQPVLMIFEDVHWADPTTLELLALIVDWLQTARVLAVITARTPFKPPWGGYGHATTLMLNRLSRRHSATMVAAMTVERVLPRAVMDEIVAKTDGVPLFVEELTKTVLESGFLKAQDGRYVLNGPLPSLAIPETLQDSLTARLDHLAAVKDVAQIGAAIGREFSYELLAVISPLGDNELQDSLQQLADAELIIPRGTPPGVTWTFKHALIQDTAYRSMLRSRRQQLHNSIAHALEDRFVDYIANEPELVGRHFTEAGLNTRAVPYWLSAGRRALGRMALPESVNHLKTALEVNGALSPSLDRDYRELEIRLVLASAIFALRGWAAREYLEALGHARELSLRLGETKRLVSTLYYTWFHHAMRCEYECATELVNELYALARSNDDSTTLLIAYSVDALTSYYMGYFTKAGRLEELVLKLYNYNEHKSLVNTFNHDPKCMTLSYAAQWQWALGWPDKSRDTSFDQLSLARDLAHPWNLIWCLTGGAWALLLRGETGLMLEWITEARSIAQDQAMATAEFGVCPFWAGQALIADGDYIEGYAQLTAGMRRWRRQGGITHVPYCNVMLVQALVGLGRIAEAASLIDEALEIIETTGHRTTEAEVHRVNGLLKLEGDRPDPAAAIVSFLKAIEVAQSQKAKSWELRAATNLARLWWSQGKSSEARDLLAPVYDWFTEGFDTPDLKQAKALLDELS